MITAAAEMVVLATESVMVLKDCRTETDFFLGSFDSPSSLGNYPPPHMRAPLTMFVLHDPVPMATGGPWVGI